MLSFVMEGRILGSDRRMCVIACIRRTNTIHDDSMQVLSVMLVGHGCH